MSHHFGGLKVRRLFVGGGFINVPTDIYSGLLRIADGSYEVSASAWKPNLPECPSVLDLGANAGTFAAYAIHRWPGCIVDSYEPEPRVFSLLKENTKNMPCVFIHQAAIGKETGTRRLFPGCDTASATFIDESEEGYWDVDCIGAAELPKADIIKVDIEGAEWEFLQNYKHLAEAAYVAIEYHRDPAEAELMIKVFKPMGFVPVKQHLSLDSPGELVFVKEKDLVKVP